MSSKEKSMWDSLTPEEQQEFWNGMSQSEQIAFAQAMEHPHQVQPKPDQAKGAKSSLFQEGSRPIFTYTEGMKTSVAGDYVSPPSTGYSARMKKTVLGVVMVVVFCITWWLVAGDAWVVLQKIGGGWDMSTLWDSTHWNPHNIYFRTKASWGIGAGLLADVLILIGVLAWQKMTFKP